MTVRRVLDHGPDGRPRSGDVVGDLVGVDAQTAVVDNGRELVEVPVATIALARQAPPSTAAELAVEAVAAKGLRAADTEQLGGWLLRADSGFTSRANSVLPLRQLGRPLDEALDAAREWYQVRGLPLKLQVPTEARRLLDAELGERGWPADLLTHVFTARIDLLRAPTPPALPEVQLAEAPSEEWLTLYRGAGARTATGRALLTRHDTVTFASLSLDGQVVAVGRGAVDDGWLGVMAVEVDPRYRRRGLAGAVMAQLWRWGSTVGAQRSYLQVAAANEPAVRLYTALGYAVHHDYHYRVPPAA